MDYIRQLRALYEVLQDQLRISRNIVSISIFVDDEWYYVGSSRRSYDRSRLEEMRKSLAEMGVAVEESFNLRNHLVCERVSCKSDLRIKECQRFALSYL